MTRSAVFALSSLYEGLPTVLVEAMAMGVPVVSTDCPHGPAEILNGGEYGELLPCGQSDRLAEAILRVLDGEKKVVPASWLNQFTAESNLAQYINLLNLSGNRVSQFEITA